MINLISLNRDEVDVLALIAKLMQITRASTLSLHASLRAVCSKALR
jgi:hypothetical protein